MTGRGDLPRGGCRTATGAELRSLRRRWVAASLTGNLARSVILDS